MLEPKDLEAIKQLLKENNKEIKRDTKKAVTESEKMLLDEIERMQNFTNEKIEKLQRNIEELTQYYRITKLESDNTKLLLQIIEDLRKDVEELKKRIA